MAHNSGFSERSPLRDFDPRIKLFLCLVASLAVMLPFRNLLAFFTIFIAFLTWARLLGQALRQLWKIKWILIVLFIADWLLVSLDLASIVTLRLSLMAIAFNMFFSTTTPAEMRIALVWMKVPYRYAFSISLAFHSIGSMNHEWRTIIEAQRSRGAVPSRSGLKNMVSSVRNLVSLTVPAIVLSTRRAWAMTEAACARGFDSPDRSEYYTLDMKPPDWYLLCVAIIVMGIISPWR